MKSKHSPICSSGCYMPHLCSGKPCLMQPRDYYPLFADLNGRACVVIGGGIIAQRKVTTLLRYGASVTVISPEITPRLSVYAKQGRIRYCRRRFKPSDLRGAWLVYASTNDEKINQRVFKTAEKRHIFANVVDQKPLCSFIAPAIVKRGPLTIAVSTGGASPSLAKKLKRELDATIGNQYAPALKLLERLRGIAKKRLPAYSDRKIYFDELVHGPVLAMTRAGRYSRARRQALAVLDRHVKAKTNGSR